MKSAQSRREINIGEEVIGIERGVRGLNGFVSLEDMVFVRSDELEDYICNHSEDRPKLPRRIP